MKKINEEEYLTIPEAAEYLQVSDKTIRNYIKKGLLRATEFGRPRLIKKRDIDAMLENQ
jgi:excisionase family DNA binding protein